MVSKDVCGPGARRAMLLGLTGGLVAALVPGRGALAQAAAAAPAGSGAIEQLRSFVAQTQGARGEFTQSTLARRGAVPQRAQGTFSFQRPGRFRWQVEKPYEQLIVADGERLALYDRDLNQVTYRRLVGALPASPASILFGAADIEREFTLTDTGTRDGLAWVSAVPRVKDAPFTRVDIGLRDALPLALTLEDSFGQVTQLAFAKIERNPRFAADSFRFVAPKGADVIEER